eukprot:856433-Lingulodinium_polyedra.AAC.1
MPESTPSFGGSSEDPTNRAAPAAADSEDVSVPRATSEQPSSDRDAAKRAALVVMTAARQQA